MRALALDGARVAGWAAAFHAWNRLIAFGAPGWKPRVLIAAGAAAGIVVLLDLVFAADRAQRLPRIRSGLTAMLAGAFVYLVTCGVD